MNKKFILIFSLLLSTISAFGNDQLLLEDATNAAYISNPKLRGSGLSFLGRYGDLSEDGVCRAMGYRQALPGSAEVSDERKYYGVLVNQFGYAIEAGVSRKVTAIVCLNFEARYPGELTIDLQMPTYPTTNVPFAYLSGEVHEDGICKALGYGSGVELSARPSDEDRNTAILVDQDGVPIGSFSSRIVTRIVCSTLDQ